MTNTHTPTHLSTVPAREVLRGIACKGGFPIQPTFATVRYLAIPRVFGATDPVVHTTDVELHTVSPCGRFLSGRPINRDGSSIGRPNWAVQFVPDEDRIERGYRHRSSAFTLCADRPMSVELWGPMEVGRVLGAMESWSVRLALSARVMDAERRASEALVHVIPTLWEYAEKYGLDPCDAGVEEFADAIGAPFEPRVTGHALTLKLDLDRFADGDAIQEAIGAASRALADFGVDVSWSDSDIEEGEH